MHFHARLDYVERRDSRGPTGTNRALGRLRAFTRAGDFILCCVSNALPEGWDSDNTDVINLSTGGGRSHWPDLDVEIDSVLTISADMVRYSSSCWLQGFALVRVEG